jgi:hypothetical protein
MDARIIHVAAAYDPVVSIIECAGRGRIFSSNHRMKGEYPFDAGWATIVARTFETAGALERIAVEQQCRHV